MITKKLTKCDFCRYATTSGCMTIPNSYYCKEASNEYYQYIRGIKPVQGRKSLKSWDKNR